jgi:hypothetical protein
MMNLFSGGFFQVLLALLSQYLQHEKTDKSSSSLRPPREKHAGGLLIQAVILATAA